MKSFDGVSGNLCPKCGCEVISVVDNTKGKAVLFVIFESTF
jgi:hypothetical protein